MSFLPQAQYITQKIDVESIVIIKMMNDDIAISGNSTSSTTSSPTEAIITRAPTTINEDNTFSSHSSSSARPAFEVEQEKDSEKVNVVLEKEKEPPSSHICTNITTTITLIF